MRGFSEEPLSLPHRQLLVSLERSGDRLKRRYRVVDGVAWDGPECKSLRKLSVTRRDDQKRYDLDLLRRVLAGGESERAAHLTGDGLDAAGELLFQILFGTAADWEDVARRLHGNPKQYPHRTRVRARIHTEDGELLGLPWRITTWDQHLLLAEQEPWTFEMTHAPSAGDDKVFAPPGRMLVIAPTGEDDAKIQELMSDTHVASLRGIVDRVRDKHSSSPDRFRPVTTWHDAVEAMKTHWDIVYYYGHGRAAGGQVSLLFGSGGGAVPIRDFVARVRQVRPSVVFLNACSLGQGGCASAGHQLGGDAPVVVAHVTAARADVARVFAVHWFTEVLVRGSDPIAAANRCLSPADLLEEGPATSAHFDHFGSLTVFGHYRTWRVHGRQPSSGFDRLRKALDLDRSAAREAFTRRVERLCQKEDMNCHALIVHATPGNRLEAIGEQLVEDAEEHFKGRIELNHVPLSAGPDDVRWDPTALHLRLAALAREQGASQQEQDMRRLLTHLAPLPLGVPHRVVVLDLGLMRQPAKPEDALLQALTFLRDRVARPALGERAARDFRVVGLVAVELPPGQVKAFSKFVQRLPRKDWETPYFEHSVLPEVGDATWSELRDFLRRTECESDLLDEVLGLLLEKTGDGEESGRYDGLVEELTYGLTHGYPALRERLLSWKAGR